MKSDGVFTLLKVVTMFISVEQLNPNVKTAFPFLIPNYYITHVNVHTLQILNIQSLLPFFISNIQWHKLQLYCNSRSAGTVIDRCLQNQAAKSHIRHMRVPPSCHVRHPMSPLWLE